MASNRLGGENIICKTGVLKLLHVLTNYLSYKDSFHAFVTCNTCSRYALPSLLLFFSYLKKYLCFMFGELTLSVKSLGQRSGCKHRFTCQVAAPSPLHTEFDVYIAAFCHAPSWQQCASNSSPFTSKLCSQETYLLCWNTSSNIAAIGFWLFFFCPDDSYLLL